MDLFDILSDDHYRHRALAMAQGCSIQDHVGDLRIPPEFAKYDDQSDPEVIVRLEQWKQRACEVLSSLRDSLHAREVVSAPDQAVVIYHVSAFDGEGSWVLDSSRETAQGERRHLNLERTLADA